MFMLKYKYWNDAVLLVTAVGRSEVGAIMDATTARTYSLWMDEIMRSPESTQMVGINE